MFSCNLLLYCLLLSGNNSHDERITDAGKTGTSEKENTEASADGKENADGTDKKNTKTTGEDDTNADNSKADADAKDRETADGIGEESPDMINKGTKRVGQADVGDTDTSDNEEFWPENDNGNIWYKYKA